MFDKNDPEIEELILSCMGSSIKFDKTLFPEEVSADFSGLHHKIFDVIDHSGIVYHHLDTELDIKLPDSSRKYIFQKVDLIANDRETLKEELKLKRKALFEMKSQVNVWPYPEWQVQEKPILNKKFIDYFLKEEEIFVKVN